VRELRDERTERALSQQQADVAAHLHDSVLQTLALIQRQASDPREVVRLARSQERDLRGWLYGVPASPDSSLRIALERVAAEVEEQHGVLIEVVVVGDCPVDPAVHALVRAAREALVNAATHAQMDRVDVFAEVEGNEVTAFVRDRGVGFDPDAIADGRMGVRGSIIERMQRHGGTATVRSTPGGGTEVRLTIKVAPEVHRAGSRQ
jgi:signal transduction histidine kinase